MVIERLESSHSVDSISDCATVWYANTIQILKSAHTYMYTRCTYWYEEGGCVEELQEEVRVPGLCPAGLLCHHQLSEVLPHRPTLALQPGPRRLAPDTVCTGHEAHSTGSCLSVQRELCCIAGHAGLLSNDNNFYQTKTKTLKA